MSNYDLIIVGAGPPGAGTAIRAAKSGLKTLMIEKGSNLKNRILNVRTAVRFKTDARHISIFQQIIPTNKVGIEFSPQRV